MLATRQLSEVVGVPSGKLVLPAVHCPGLVLTVTSGGQVIVGGCVSLTVMVNVQLGPAVVVHVTVVAPTGKNEPELGLQDALSQVRLIVGGG
jgi:hypothetical protein